MNDTITPSAGSPLTISDSKSTHSNSSPVPAYRWIVGPRYDLLFFIGSCLLTFAFYGLYRVAHHFGFFLRGDSILITYFLFTKNGVKPLFLNMGILSRVV